MTASPEVKKPATSLTAESTRAECEAWDESHPLRGLRDLFDMPQDIAYLCGNSLGPLPHTAKDRISQVVHEEWGRQLVGGWTTSDWMSAPLTIGAKIAPLIGANPEDVVAVDTTGVNMYKAMVAAVQAAPAGRRIVLTERDNFPADHYAAQSVVAQHGLVLQFVDDWRDLAAAIEQVGDDLAVVMLTDVNYRTGVRLNMAELTAATHRVGAIAVWDLAHSAGAVPVDVMGADADFAVGCSYKYLNGGPGAPAFVWAHPRHQAVATQWQELAYPVSGDAAQPGAADQEATLQGTQPIWGWWGCEDPFSFLPSFVPAAGISQWRCSSPSILGLAGLECGVGTHHAAMEHGGMAALWQKSTDLTTFFMDAVAAKVGDVIECVTPRDIDSRSSQVSFTCTGDLAGAEYAIVRALIDRKVIGDYRQGEDARPDRPHLMRFGVAPLYVRAVDIFDAAETMATIVREKIYAEDTYQARAAVT